MSPFHDSLSPGSSTISLCLPNSKAADDGVAPVPRMAGCRSSHHSHHPGEDSYHDCLGLGGPEPRLRLAYSSVFTVTSLSPAPHSSPAPPAVELLGFGTGHSVGTRPAVPLVGPKLSSLIMLWPSAPEGGLDGMHILEPNFMSFGALQAGKWGGPWEGLQVQAQTAELKPERRRDRKRGTRGIQETVRGKGIQYCKRRILLWEVKEAWLPSRWKWHLLADECIIPWK